MEKIQTNATLIIPALNEEGCIGQTIKEIPRGCVDEVIVVDGYSADNTTTEAQEAMRTTGQYGRVINRTKEGFGVALCEGAEAAQGNILIFMDADGSQNPADLLRLLEKYEENTVVMASRYASGGRSDDDTFVRWFGNWLFTKFTNLIHGIHTTDSLYFFLAISKKNFQKLNLRLEDYRICIEFLVKAKRNKLKIVEIPAIERPRLAGESKVNAFRDGLKILRAILSKY